MKYFSIIFLIMMFKGSLFANQIESVKETSEDSNKPQQVSQVDKNKNDSGASIYENHCIVCHRDGIMGAPRYQDDKDWNSRLNNKKLEDLLASAIKGINGMPARGTCPECSDEDLKAAIQYMLPHHE